MPITPQEIADGFNSLGIDTLDELAAALKSLRNKGPELERRERQLNRLEKRLADDLNARNAEADKLRNALQVAIAELKDGDDVTGALPNNAQLNEVAPQTPFAASDPFIPA